MIRTPIAAKTASNAAVNFASRSRIKNFKLSVRALEIYQQVAGLLGHPRARRVRGDPGQVHAPRAVLDEEQHVQAPQKQGIDVEEVHGQDRRGLARPGTPARPARGAGSMPASLRICHTVDGASVQPRPVSSP